MVILCYALWYFLGDIRGNNKKPQIPWTFWNVRMCQSIPVYRSQITCGLQLVNKIRLTLFIQPRTQIPTYLLPLHELDFCLTFFVISWIIFLATTLVVALQIPFLSHASVPRQLRYSPAFFSVLIINRYWWRRVAGLRVASTRLNQSIHCCQNN